ncbi:hypothetical protein BEWA_040740 [Theileria equi strain WA]|uniref:Uncharacterized protein n=1 Tax=Theileria equi strain WA TaxID=1537102 RepID=L1LFA2_THEEQ|nr:hypothetical protein BEWA_040740 [Theileria equi strain WA]EKX74036.1 hypothetical protein BEWA_040740 [Theileria equi strain WA]|eukprot:XP_004833488.1 hypothetical protein BEWA_040740 [Theileria equi strain WA]
MKEIDPLVTVETICGFYHPSASFPIVLDELPQESDMCSLIHIGNLTNHDISVNHLSRHELLLLISDGSHGKDLVEYLYRERVFPDEYRNEGSNSGYAKYYFVYPCKYSETSVHNSSWLTKNLNRHSQDKIAESITYIPVVTDEKYLKMVSVFLLELSDTNSSSLSSTNAFIDTLVQNKASKVIGE